MCISTKRCYTFIYITYDHKFLSPKLKKKKKNAMNENEKIFFNKKIILFQI